MDLFFAAKSTRGLEPYESILEMKGPLEDEPKRLFRPEPDLIYTHGHQVAELDSWDGIFHMVLDVKGLSGLTYLYNIMWTSGTVPLEYQTGLVVLRETRPRKDFCLPDEDGALAC